MRPPASYQERNLGVNQAAVTNGWLGPFKGNTVSDDPGPIPANGAGVTNPPKPSDIYLTPQMTRWGDGLVMPPLFASPVPRCFSRFGEGFRVRLSGSVQVPLYASGQVTAGQYNAAVCAARMARCANPAPDF
ncbi:hypothetical protein GCM10025794_27370 [Massilia kyonggiensis]